MCLGCWVFSSPLLWSVPFKCLLARNRLAFLIFSLIAATEMVPYGWREVFVFLKIQSVYKSTIIIQKHFYKQLVTNRHTCVIGTGLQTDILCHFLVALGNILKFTFKCEIHPRLDGLHCFPGHRTMPFQSSPITVNFVWHAYKINFLNFIIHLFGCIKHNHECLQMVLLYMLQWNILFSMHKPLN